MTELRVSYAWVSTDEQDFAVQRADLVTLGVEADRVYVDTGLSGTPRGPGCARALRRAAL